MSRISPVGLESGDLQFSVLKFVTIFEFTCYPRPFVFIWKICVVVLRVVLPGLGKRT